MNRNATLGSTINNKMAPPQVQPQEEPKQQAPPPPNPALKLQSTVQRIRDSMKGQQL